MHAEPAGSGLGALKLQRGSAVLTALIASLVLFGWMFEIDVLKRIIPGLVAMNPMTAVAFLLAALSLLLFTEEASASSVRRLARISALAVALIGLAKLTAMAGGPDLRIDRALFSESLKVGFAVPNVMAPNTALNFVLVGGALFLVHSKRRRASPIACIAALICGFEALLAILGYLYGVSGFYKLQAFIPMALHTAIGFLVVTFGIMACQAHHGFLAAITGPNAGGMMARRLLPATILLPAVLGWLRIEGQRMGFFDTDFGVALYTVTNMLVFGSLVACNAFLLFKTDAARAQADSRLRRAHEQLEARVEERTAQLSKANGELREARAQLEERVRERTATLAENKRQLEAALQTNQLIMDKSRDVICTIDPAGHFVTLSAACETLWGYEPTELIGKAYIEMVYPDDREKTNRVAAQIIAGTPVSDFENRYLRKDGSVINVMWSAYWSEVDQIMFAVARDITERARVTEALNQAKQAADRANHAKSEFLSRMSHELRTPMNAILGFAQLLEMDQLTAEQQESTSHIIRGGRHLLELINEVLDISRIEAGRMSLSTEPVDLAEALRETVEMVRPLAADRALTITLPPVCDSYVMADRQRLKQVLINLVSNAIKYNRPGGSVTIACMQTDHRVRILVKDTGLGIPAERIPHLFTPFERLGAEQGETEGTGLGLVVSKRLVEAMQGNLEMESLAGEGTTFCVELPSTQAPLLPAELAEAEFVGEQINPTEKRSILYIEDNLSNLRLVEQVLSHRPAIRLLIARDGREGLKLAAEHNPDLILLDLNLPDMHGHDVLIRLQSDPRFVAIPVIVISADAMNAQKERLLQAGASQYLTKPLNIKKFLEILDRSLASASQSA